MVHSFLHWSTFNYLYQDEGNDGKEKGGHHVADRDGRFLDQFDGDLDSSTEEDEQDQDDQKQDAGQDEKYEPEKNMWALWPAFLTNIFMIQCH